jgi:UDP-3-O-[3-hydroxymyristoyl] glucosamine N-acyltransferase
LAANGASGLRDPHARVAVFEQLQAAGLRCPVLVHRSAVVEPSSELADGVQVLALAYIGSEARVGRGSIVNTAAVVSHRCELGVCVNVSPGALLAGQVVVGDGSVIGMGVTVNIGVRIGTGARIGNGARVHADVPDGSIVRAGVDWSG